MDNASGLEICPTETTCADTAFSVLALVLVLVVVVLAVYGNFYGEGPRVLLEEMGHALLDLYIVNHMSNDIHTERNSTDCCAELFVLSLVVVLQDQLHP